MKHKRLRVALGLIKQALYIAAGWAGAWYLNRHISFTDVIIVTVTVFAISMVLFTYKRR